MNAPHTPAESTQPAAPQPWQWALTRVATLRIDEAQAQERFNELKAALPSRAARRMSRLGLMLAHLLEQTGVSEEMTVIYGSAFAEGRTLETYLESFPQPSPLGFQSSIHPSGIEQVLILRRQPVRAFFPLADDGHLPLALLRTLLFAAAGQRALLLGGEECATWLTGHRLAAAENFAFALMLEPINSTAETAAATAADTGAGANADTFAILRYHPEGSEQAATRTAGSNDTGSNDTAGNHASATRPASDPSGTTSPASANSGNSANACTANATTVNAAAACPRTPPPASPPALSLGQLCDALACRSPLRLPHADGGCWTLDWN